MHALEEASARPTALEYLARQEEKMIGREKVFATIVVSGFVAMLVSFTPTTASADTTNLNADETINLAYVITNGLSVQIGDKVFGEFDFNNNNAPDVAASNVDVRALLNLNDVGFRLEFQQPLTATGFESQDLVFEYTAAVAPGYDNLISDIHLSIAGDADGGFAPVAEDAFNLGFGAGNVGHVDVFFPDVTETWTNIVPPQPKLWIEKDVYVIGAGGSCTITNIEQTFSQIPEPSTALLVGLGLLGAVALKRKS